MKVAIRVDASRAIGTGHVRRCLALAAALREAGADPCFIVRLHDIDVAAMIEPHRYELHLLPRPNGSLQPSAVPHGPWAGVPAEIDAEETAQLARDADWIVIDHYGFDAAWHRVARQATGARIAVVDDLADRPLSCDLIVDHNYDVDHRAKYAERAPGVPILGGPRFALLGRTYADGPRHEPGDMVRSIGIFMGGIDKDDVTSLVLDALSAVEVPIEVVTTSGNPQLESLRARRGIGLSVDLPDLAAFFARHDLQIGAGGGATWERCCVGAPTLLLQIAANQENVVPKLARLGAVATAPLETEAIRKEVEALLASPSRRAELSRTARSLVDGLGARRVAIRLARQELTVRRVAMSDGVMMHRWRDHPEVRGRSGGSDSIPLESHLAWLERSVDNPDRYLMMGMVGSIPVGVVRYDVVDETRLKVSTYTDPDLHGLGLGAPLMIAAEKQLPQHLDIECDIFEDNVASQRMVAAAGYGRDRPGHWIKPAPSRA